MKNTIFKKIISSFMIAIFTMAYTMPSGMCISTVVKQNQKPALREVSQANALILEGDISITKGNPKISLSLRDSDAQQVLRMFADKAGLNIIFHDSVSGKVTMDLVNVPLNDAFKMVLQITNLTYYIDNNTMVVASASAAQTLNLAKQELITIPVKYVNASTIADFLNKNIFSINKPGLSNSQIAITNPASNEILIFGTKNDYLMAKKVVEQFDKKPLEESFLVRHTTPKEMAKLICDILINPGSSGGKSTGGAASSSSSSSSSSSGGSSLSLGEGIVACKNNEKINAGSLSSLATNSLTVAYFAQRGSISVTGGSAQQMEAIRDFILKNDKKQPQAYLEISIIELNESGSRQFSNTWQVYSGFFSGSFNGSLSNFSNFPIMMQNSGIDIYDIKSATDPQKIKYTLSKYTGTPTIAYTMNYLIENGKGRTLANPRIMVTNGQESTIDLTSDYVQSVTTQVLSGTIAGATQRTYNIASDDGIKVTVTPFISPEGYVTLNIKPDFATIKEKITAPNATDPTIQDIQATLLQRRNLELKNIRIRDGETLVIGGMNREVETKNISKLPVLGDLPGVGMFFRNTITSKSKEELVIMITPKIIKETEDIVNKSNVNL